MNTHPNHEWLNYIAKKASENAANKGFRSTEFSTVEACRTPAYMLRQKNLIRGEIGEAYEALRKGYLGTSELTNLFERIAKSEYKEPYETHIKGTLGEELADIVIRALDCAGALQIKFSEEGDGGTGYWKEGEDFDTIFDFFYTLLDSLFIGDGSDWGIDALHYISISIREIIGYACDVATFYDINLYKHIDLKMLYNSMRPILHGKKF
jgi:hypothetical protein